MQRLDAQSDSKSIRSSSEAASSPIPFVNIHPASEKRNDEFHLLFRSVPEDDPLIEDYSCALQRDILIHGRLYLTRRYLCFNSNIFGWVTNVRPCVSSDVIPELNVARRRLC